MLHLHIVNYTIIKELEINFSKGFQVITGETGAGKSILLGALSLILGERAESILLLDKEKKCIVEGVFALPENQEILLKIFQQLDIDADNEILIRREINSNGKSRAFVNDTPVNLVQLRTISNLLVDLHQQFDTQELGEMEFQRSVVDCLAATGNDLIAYQKIYRTLSEKNKQIARLKEEQLQANKTLDYNQFLYQELEEANLEPGMLEQMEAELKLLVNAENIKTALQQITDGLLQSDQPIVQQLKQLAQVLKGIAGYQEDLVVLQSRLQTSIIEIDDIAAELEQVNDRLHFDAERIEMIQDKINLGYKLLKKHQVQTTNQLLDIKENLALQLKAVSNGEDTIHLLEAEATILQEQVQQMAMQMHEKRKKVALPLQQQINHLLHQVGMPNAAVKIEVLPAALQEYGNSNISFLFDANKSNRFEVLRKVASGGELSRLMLCIKSLVANAMQLPVLIFDEIDTGISGEAARQVGLIMSALSKKHQVICITHQAQIAAKANNHYFVYKTITDNTVSTGIKVLTTEERITTIAQMMSGEKPTAAALQNAREMVGN